MVYGRQISKGEAGRGMRRDVVEGLGGREEYS
jgi:hypothetical protein